MTKTLRFSRIYFPTKKKYGFHLLLHQPNSTVFPCSFDTATPTDRFHLWFRPTATVGQPVETKVVVSSPTALLPAHAPQRPPRWSLGVRGVPWSAGWGGRGGSPSRSNISSAGQSSLFPAPAPSQPLPLPSGGPHGGASWVPTVAWWGRGPPASAGAPADWEANRPW